MNTLIQATIMTAAAYLLIRGAEKILDKKHRKENPWMYDLREEDTYD